MIFVKMFCQFKENILDLKETGDFSSKAIP